MGVFSDMWDALTGKVAKERKEAKKANNTLQQELEELRTEKAKLETEKRGLTQKNEALRQTHVQGAKNAFEGGKRLGRKETESRLTHEGWMARNKGNDLSKQEQMAKFLAHLANDEILPQDENKALLTLSDFMKSDSVDIMEEGGRNSLLEGFIHRFSDKSLSKEQENFYRKAFKIMLNAKGKDGPKADITSDLVNGPLIGYFVIYDSLRPFLKTAIDSAAFNPEKFDGDHYLRVVHHTMMGREILDAVEPIFMRGCEPKGEYWQEYHDELKAEGRLKDPPKGMDDKLQQRLNKMSSRELLKTLKEGVINGEIEVKKKTASKRKGKGE